MQKKCLTSKMWHNDMIKKTSGKFQQISKIIIPDTDNLTTNTAHALCTSHVFRIGPWQDFPSARYGYKDERNRLQEIAQLIWLWWPCRQFAPFNKSFVKHDDDDYGDMKHRQTDAISLLVIWAHGREPVRCHWKRRPWVYLAFLDTLVTP